MHSTSIFLVVFGLLVAVAMARPGRRPWSGYHHHEKPENEGSEGQKWSTYRLPDHIRLPQLLTGKLEKPWATFTARKILNGKYLLVSPALIFKIKDVDNETESSTTAVPEIPSTDEPEVVETTTATVDEETTSVAVDEEETTTVAVDEEETTTPVPAVLGKRSFPIDDNEQLLFLDD